MEHYKNLLHRRRQNEIQKRIQAIIVEFVANSKRHLIVGNGAVQHNLEHKASLSETISVTKINRSLHDIVKRQLEFIRITVLISRTEIHHIT